MARTNAERQAAWRARQQEELRTLRAFRHDTASRPEADPPEDDPLVARVLNAVTDGKWHRLSAIVTAAARGGLDITEADVLPVLEAMRLRGAYRAVAERRTGATGWSYRIVFGAGRTIDVGVLMAELEPLLRALELEGRKNMATASPGTVARLATELRRVLRQLCR